MLKKSFLKKNSKVFFFLLNKNCSLYIIIIRWNMKRLKKLLIIFILLISFMYIGKVEVEAKEEKKKNTSIATFNFDNVNLECTYSDGRKYSFQGLYSDLDQEYSISNKELLAKDESALLTDYLNAFNSPTSSKGSLKYDSLYYEDISLGKAIPERNRLVGTAVFSKPSFIARGKNGLLYCAPELRTVKVGEGADSKNEKNEGNKDAFTFLTFNPYFNFDECKSMAGSNGWGRFWNTGQEQSITASCAQMQKSKLLSVEYTMNEATETKTYFLERNMTLKSSGKDQYGTDAVSSKEQVYVYVYNNLVLVERNNHYIPLIEGADIFKNTSLDSKIASGKTATVYLNDPFFKKVGDYFEASDDKHYKASKTKQAGYIEYKVSDVAQKETDNKDANRSICDYIPETSKLIRKAIKTLQILLPVILIISIVIDVLNIVKSDNQEKDIPALTKKIRTRLILAVVFFILPVLVGLIIRMLNQYTTIKNVAQIRCLFE